MLQRIAAQVFQQVVPAGRREAQAEVAGDDAGKSASLQVVDRGLAGRMALQRLAVEIGSGGEQRIEGGVDRLPRFVPASTVLAWDFESGAPGELLDRLGKSR